MLEAHRLEVTKRLSEVRVLVEHIRALEEAPPASDSAEVRILRGLFYVHLYAALEFTVSRGVQRFLQSVSDMEIPPAHLEAGFLSVVLDPAFSAMRNVGEDKKWSGRLKLWKLQSSKDPHPVNGEPFGLYLQNVWIEKLDVLFECLGMSVQVTPDPAFRTYVDELVERRNGVAHGRFSAHGIGSARRSPELLIRFNAISDTCFHITDSLEQHFASRGVVRPRFRRAYPLV